MLEEMKVPDLKILAKQHGIENADSLKKAELIEAISKSPGAEPKQSPENAVIDESKVEAKHSSHDSDIAKHPKFAKFNSHGGK